MQHPEAMQNRMEALFTCIPSAMIPAILTLIKADINYVRWHNDRTFQFSGYLDSLVLPPSLVLSSKKKKMIVDTLSDVFSKLYNDFFAHRGSNCRFNNRERFKEEYRRLNFQKMNICPACLGQMYLGKAQLDHYFPKKQIREREIVFPLGHKGGQLVNHPGCLANVYVPYIRSGEKKFSTRMVGDPGNRIVKIEVLPDEDLLEKERIDRFVTTYNLENVWTERISFHYNILMQRALTEFSTLYSMGKSISEIEVGDFLWNKLVLESDKDALFQVGYQFEFINYVISISTMPDSFHAFYKELIKRLKIKKKTTFNHPYLNSGFCESL